MHVHELNWMHLEEYLTGDDRIVLPLGSTEQHGYLSLGTDNILGEQVSLEAAEPLGVPVLPVLPYGLTPAFGAFPGSPSLRFETLIAVLRDVLDSLHEQGFRRFLVVNAHGGNAPVSGLIREWASAHPDGQAIRTTTVPWISCCWPGQSTFFSSPHDSWTKFQKPPPGTWRPPSALAGSAAGRSCCCCWRGRVRWAADWLSSCAARRARRSERVCRATTSSPDGACACRTSGSTC